MSLSHTSPALDQFPVVAPRGACSIFGWFNVFVTSVVESFFSAAFVIEGRFTARSRAAIEPASKHVA
jgi:hypothetical protein